jgi:hypothetical protein
MLIKEHFHRGFGLDFMKKKINSLDFLQRRTKRAKIVSQIKKQISEKYKEVFLFSNIF